MTFLIGWAHTQNDHRYMYDELIVDLRDLCTYILQGCSTSIGPVVRLAQCQWRNANAYFCSEWCLVGYGTGALWDLWDWSIGIKQSKTWYWSSNYMHVSWDVLWMTIVTYNPRGYHYMCKNTLPRKLMIKKTLKFNSLCAETVIFQRK